MSQLPVTQTVVPQDAMSLTQLAALLGYTRTDNLLVRLKKLLPSWIASGDAVKGTRLVARKKRGSIPATEYWFTKRAAYKIVLMSSNRPNTGLDFQQIADSLDDEERSPGRPPGPPQPGPPQPEPVLLAPAQLRLPPGVLRAPLPEGRGELISIQALPPEQRARIRTILEARSRGRTESPPTRTLRAQK